MIYTKNMSQLPRQSWDVDSGLVVWPLASIQINCRIFLWPKAGHCLIHIFSEHQLVGELKTSACGSFVVTGHEEKRDHLNIANCSERQ
jgi:hypothetical protein